MQVAFSAPVTVCAHARAAAAASTSARRSKCPGHYHRPAGGLRLLPVRRAAVGLRRSRGVAASASMGSGGEFPAFDAAAATVANMHAAVFMGGGANDAVSPLFQIADSAAALPLGDVVEEIPGLQKGGWLGPITDLLESILKARPRRREHGASCAPALKTHTRAGGLTRRCDADTPPTPPPPQKAPHHRFFPFVASSPLWPLPAYFFVDFCGGCRTYRERQSAASRPAVGRR